MTFTMTKSLTPTYRIEVTDVSGQKHKLAFPFRATQKSIMYYVDSYNRSILYGVNSHLGKEALLTSAKVIAQKGSRRGEVVLQATVSFTTKPYRIQAKLV